MLSNKNALLLSLVVTVLAVAPARAADNKVVLLFNNDIQKADGKTSACGIVLVEGNEGSGETLKFESFASRLQNGTRINGFIVSVGQATGGTPPVRGLPLEAATFSPIGNGIDAQDFSVGTAGGSVIIQTQSATAGDAAYQAFLKGGYKVMAKETGGRIHQFEVPAKPTDPVISQNTACLESLGK